MPLWSPDEPCTAVWSKEVIALWKPQRPTRTIRIMCFWVTGAQFQAWYYCCTSQQWQWWGNGLTLAFAWRVIAEWEAPRCFVWIGLLLQPCHIFFGIYRKNGYSSVSPLKSVVLKQISNCAVNKAATLKMQEQQTSYTQAKCIHYITLQSVARASESHISTEIDHRVL